MQLSLRNNCCPCQASDPSVAPPVKGACQFASPRRNASNSPWVTTRTLPTIIECHVPQYWLQNRWYSPSLFGTCHWVVYRPGSTSTLSRNAGRPNEWITSSETIVNLTGRSIGRTSDP